MRPEPAESIDRFFHYPYKASATQLRPWPGLAHWGGGPNRGTKMGELEVVAAHGDRSTCDIRTSEKGSGAYWFGEAGHSLGVSTGETRSACGTREWALRSQRHQVSASRTTSLSTIWLSLRVLKLTDKNPSHPKTRSGNRAATAPSAEWT